MYGKRPGTKHYLVVRLIETRMVKIFELGFAQKGTPLACHALRLVFRSSFTDTQRQERRQSLRGESMDWKHLLAYMIGSIDQELLVRKEYLVTENRILRHEINGRVRSSDSEPKTLAELGQKLGKQALQEVAKIVKPDKILS
jgi:hypothetical protein